MMIRPLLVISIIVLVFSLDQVVGKEKVYHAAINDKGVQEVEITGDSYYFEPDHIILKVNIPVEFKIKKNSAGIVPHNIIVDAPEAGIMISKPINLEPRVIRFTPTKIGKYAFYCDKRLLFFKSHREKGMEGMLEVIN
jgi:plastocyanin domain-containing protein